MSEKSVIQFDETYQEIVTTQIVGTPLVEIISVTIHPNNGATSEVFGTIEVADGEGAEFNLYNRKYEDAETVAKGGPLTLTMPKGRAISASTCVNLSVHLEDKNHKTVIAEGTCSWEYQTEHDYDENRTEKFGGKCGYAILHYVTYGHAVVANVDVLFIRGNKDDSGGDYADVFGDIIAQCGSNSTTLFSRTQQQSIRVNSGTSIDISRHVVSVPTHSSLVLALKLWNRDLKNQMICQDMHFMTTHYSCIHNTDVEGQNGHIEVEVHWSHICALPLPERRLKNKIEQVSDEESMKKQKRVHVDSDQQSSSTLSWSLVKSPIKVIEVLVLEVFSIVIRSDSGKGLDVCGLIQYTDWAGHKFYFFNKDQTSAERVLPNQHVNIMAPKVALAALGFGVKAYLKEANGNVICAGEMIYGEREVDDLPFQCYDKQLCSVIRGNNGYMAIYHTNFSDAMQASLEVRYEGECSCTSVHGSIFTEYSNYRYVTWYEKQHYRNKIFQSTSDKCVKLDADSHLHLSKSVVAVPRDASLIFDVDLTMNASGSGDKETFKDLQRIDVGHKRDIRIQGSNQNRVIIEVEWSEVSILPFFNSRFQINS